jgi:hypothetical protein
MLNGPPLTSNNAGQYAVDNIATDADSKYVESFGPQYVMGPKVQHKWYEVYDIGVESRTGSNQVNYVSPLAAGTLMRIHADSTPDYWLIGSLVNAANTSLKIWTSGDPGGHPVRLGNGGTCCIPSKGHPDLCIQAVGGSVIGTVIALGGYEAGTITMNIANQP